MWEVQSLSKDLENINVSTSGSSGRKNKGGGGGGSGSKDTTEKAEKFDWIKVKIDKVRYAYDQLMEEVNDSENAYSTQLNFLDSAIEKQKNLIDLEKLGIDAYQREFDSVASKIPEDIKNKIMNGDFQIETLQGNSNKELIESVKETETAWKNLDEAQKQYATDIKTLETNEKNRYNKSIEWKQSEIDNLKEKADIEQVSYEKNLQLMDDAIKKSEELVEIEKKHTEEIKSAWENLKEQIKPQDIAGIMDGNLNIEQYVEIDPEYYELLKKAISLYSDYLKSVENLQDKETKLEDTRKKAYEKAIQYIDSQISYISGMNDKISAEKDLIEAIGGIVTEDLYQEMIDNSEKMMSLYESKMNTIQSRLSYVSPDSAEYFELLGNLQDCQKSLLECQKNQAEWNEAIIRLPIERIQKYLNELAHIKQDLNNFLNQKTSVGVATNKEQFEQLISINQAQIDKYVEQQKKLQGLLGRFQYGSEKFNQTSNEIQEIDNAISDLIVEMQNYNYQMARIPVDNLQKLVDTLDNAQTSMENLVSQQEAHGVKTTVDQYQMMIDLAYKRIAALNAQKSMLVQLQSQFEKDSDRYTEIGNEINGIDNTIAGIVTNQYEWNKAMLQTPIDRLSDVNTELSSYSNILGDVLSEYDSALSGVNRLLDEQIKKINEAREATEKEYEAKIKPLEDELELLQKANEARKIQTALEQAQYNLDKARQQKKTKVVRNGELAYESDPEEIRSAQQALQDAEFNKAKYDLEKQIESLEEERDALLENYDDQLESLNKIKDRWSEIVDQIQLAADKAKAENLFGDGWENKILSGDDDDLYKMFQNLYSATSEQKNKVDEQISSNERIVEMMQLYADRFQSGAMTYDQAMAGINDLMTSMKDGYTALENLGSLMKADGIGNIGEIASSATVKIANSLTELSSVMGQVKNNYASMDQLVWSEVKQTISNQMKVSDTIANTMNQFNDYIGVFKSNTEAIGKYTKTWDEMKADLAAQLEALKKAAEALEKLAAQKKQYSSSSGGSSSDEDTNNWTDGNIGVNIGGHKVYEYDGKGNYYFESKDENGKGTGKYDDKVTDRKEKNERWEQAVDEYHAEKELKKKKHDGIKSGLVGSNVSLSDKEREERFKALGLVKLNSDEMLIKALRNEVVLTKEQQENLLSNFRNVANAGVKAGMAINTPNSTNNQMFENNAIEVNVGDIHVHDVGDVNGFARSLKNQINPIMGQVFSKK